MKQSAFNIETRGNMEEPLRRTTIRISLLLAATVACALATSPSIAHAGSTKIVVADSTGVERARGELDASGRLKFFVTDASGAPAQGAEISLKNSVTGEIVSSQSIDGVASFQGIAPGNWTVASLTPGITFTEVQVGSTVALASASGLGAVSAASVGVGALAVGAAAVGVVAVTDGNSNDEDPISPFT